jgi:hypothetical protein
MLGVSHPIMKVLAKLGDFLQRALQRAVLEVAQGSRPDPEKLAAWLEKEMIGWDPQVKGRKLSDPATRKAAARFMAGVACNFAVPQKEGL